MTSAKKLWKPIGWLNTPQFIFRAFLLLIESKIGDRNCHITDQDYFEGEGTGRGNKVVSNDLGYEVVIFLTLL